MPKQFPAFLDHSLPLKLYRHLLGIVGMRKDDIILTSFPKSGNTWVRFFFCNLISISEWQGRPVDFQKLNKTMPEFGVNNLMRKWAHSTIPRVVKTHKPFHHFFKDKRVVLVVRDPRDVMVSFFHYAKGRDYAFQGDFPSFIRHPRLGLPAWFAYHQSWAGVPRILLNYEDLLTDDIGEFTRMIDLLGLEVPEPLLVEATERSRFKKIRSLEVKFDAPQSKGAEKQFLFTRKGIVGDWKNHFSPEDIAYYEDLVQRHQIPGFPLVS